MPAGNQRTRVVLDINVYLDYIRGGDGSLLLPSPDQIPSGAPAADSLVLAFDDRYALFASPHILRNINRVMRADGQSDPVRRRFIEFITETCQLSGGAVLDPVVRDHAIGDHEDNHILSLAADPYVDADVVVSSDHDLLSMGPAWNGRLIMQPRQFAQRMARAAQVQASPLSVPAPEPTPEPAPVRKRPADRFPELRDIHLERPGTSVVGELSASGDDFQR